MKDEENVQRPTFNVQRVIREGTGAGRVAGVCARARIRLLRAPRTKRLTHFDILDSNADR